VGWGVQGTAQTCFLGRLEARRSVKVRFVPPGSRLNPYPLGTAVALYDGWRFKVNSATINADSEVEAFNDGSFPPPAGAQYTLVNVTATYLGGGSSNLSSWLQVEEPIEAEGAGNAEYGLHDCPIYPLDLIGLGDEPVFSG
jgi:hypothetical protein